MPLVANCASTWANQMLGSAGQNDGSLIETAATRGCSPSSPDIVAAEYTRQCHQLWNCHHDTIVYTHEE